MLTDWRPRLGTVLDNAYRLDEEIGVGPVSANYLATDIQSSSQVVLKVFPPTLFDGELRGPNILRLQRARAYVHSGLAPLYDVVLTGDAIYVVRDVVDALPYDRWLDENAPVSRERIAVHVSQLVEAVAHIHQIGVHGNLKPSNVFVGPDEKLLITDPWFLEGVEGVNIADLLSRSSRWLAPEQKEPGWQERPETDVFLLGLMLGWLLAGRVTAAGRPLNEQRVMVRKAVDDVYVMATQRAPSDRFADVYSFRDALATAWSDVDLFASDPNRTSPSTVVGFDDELAVTPDNVQRSPSARDDLESALIEPPPTDAAEVDALTIDLPDDTELFELSEADILESSPPSLESTPFAEEPLSGQGVEGQLPPEFKGAQSNAPSQAVTQDDIVLNDSIKDAVAAHEEPTRPTVFDDAQPSVAVAPPVGRSRSIYFVPVFVALAAVAMFFLLRSVSQTAPVDEAGIAALRTTQESPITTSDSAGVASADVMSAVPDEDAAPAVKAAVVDAVALTPEVVESETAAGQDVVGPNDVTAQEQEGTAAPNLDALTPAKASAGQTATTPAKEEASPPPRDKTVNPKDYRCPKGMARIRGRKTVEGDDGMKRKVTEVWCTDKYEYPGPGAMPTTGVTLAAARSACRAQGKRLCSRREWRIACGGSKYPYRGDYDPTRCNTVGADGLPAPVAVTGSKKRCKSAFGTFDMVGNVAEWTADGRVNGGSSKRGESASCYRSARRMGGSS